MTAERRIGAGVIAALLVVYLVWGTTYYAMRVALREYSAFYLCGVRFLLAGGLLFAYTLAVGALRVNRGVLLDAAVTGVLLVTLGNGLVASAEQRVSSGIAALVVSTEPVFILLLSLGFGRRPGAGELAGVALCLSGVAVLALGAEFRYSPTALAALLLASLAWALGSIWSAQRGRSESALSGVALQMGIGGAISVGVGWASNERWVWDGALDAQLALLYLALFGSIATFVSYDYLIRNVSLSLSTSYAYVNPAIAFGVGCVVDEDVFRVSTALSLLCVLVGVWLIVRHDARAREAASTPEPSAR